jgi:hypothetical protein
MLFAIVVTSLGKMLGAVLLLVDSVLCCWFVTRSLCFTAMSL